MADTKLKRAARTRQQRTGERYTTALEAVRQEHAMTDEEILAQAEEIKARRSAERQAVTKACEWRIQELLRGAGKPFTDDELRYAAYDRCVCGAGMAYPLNTGMRGAWDCSTILKGKALQASDPASVKHTGRKPFMVWKVKGEGQSSAQGATTRPTDQGSGGTTG